MLNPSSKLKGEKDWQKYEKARKLKDKIEKIREDYMQVPILNLLNTCKNMSIFSVILIFLQRNPDFKERNLAFYTVIGIESSSWINVMLPNEQGCSPLLQHALRKLFSARKVFLTNQRNAFS